MHRMCFHRLVALDVTLAGAQKGATTVGRAPEGVLAMRYEKLAEVGAHSREKGMHLPYVSLDGALEASLLHVDPFAVHAGETRGALGAW